MNRSRFRSRALGVCAVLLGLMALGVSGAQAEIEASWKMNGTEVSTGLLPTLQIGEIENSTASLFTKIAGANVTFVCTAAELIGAKLELEGKVTAGTKTKFSGCVTLLNGAPSPACVPKSSGQSNGTILTQELKGLRVLHEGKGFVRIEAKTGETLATLLFNVAGGCSLPESVPVKGKLFLKDSKGEEKVELVSHLIQQATLTKLFVISDTVEHAASTEGSATVALASPHVGLKWGDGEAKKPEESDGWMVKGANLNTLLLPFLEINEIENKTIQFLTKFGAEISFLCTSAALSGAKLELNRKITSGFKIKFTGCITLINKTLSAACAPHTSGEPAGSLLFNELKGSLVLHEGKGLIRIEPLTGETFATLQFNVAGGCTLPESISFKGKLFLQECKGELAVEKTTHLFEQGPLTHMYIISDTAEHAINIDGSAIMAIGGAHAGLSWSGLPE